jgi:hypothetical protein
MFVCVLCAFFLFLQSQVRQPADLIKKVSEDLSLDKPLQCNIQSQQISL